MLEKFGITWLGQDRRSEALPRQVGLAPPHSIGVVFAERRSDGMEAIGRTDCRSHPHIISEAGVDHTRQNCGRDLIGKIDVSHLRGGVNTGIGSTRSDNDDALRAEELCQN